MLLVGLKEGSIYTGQITPYHGKVQAEIVCKNNSYKESRYSGEIWICIMYKEFGRLFASQPREKDYIKAEKWIKEQLALIEKYGTVVVKQPEPITTSLKNSKEA